MRKYQFFVAENVWDFFLVLSDPAQGHDKYDWKHHRHYTPYYVVAWCNTFSKELLDDQ